MLAFENRLKNENDFEKVKKDGKLYQAEDFGVSVFKRDDKEPSRFGFVISSKISKIAVHRNRIKRALVEAVRYNINHLPKGYDMVFLVKKSITKKTTDEIMKQVNVFFNEKEFVK